MLHVIVRERRHREVTVVVVRLEPNIQFLVHARFLCGRCKVLREQLFLRVEVVAGAHIDQEIQRSLPFLNELRRVMLLPLLLVVLAKVPLECLLAPGAVDGVCDGRECGDGLVFPGVFEELVVLVSIHRFPLSLPPLLNP
jgi:hypothetical protein